MSFDPVTVAQAVVQGKKKFADVKLPRRRDLPGIAGIPVVMAAPYTVTSAVASAGTALWTGSSVTSPVYVAPFTPGAFRVTGCKPTRALVAGSVPAATSTATYTAVGKTSSSPWEIEFVLDTVGGKFDIMGRNVTGSDARILIDGQALTAYRTVTAPGNDGAPARHTVSGLPAGPHRVKIEATSQFYFCGVVIGPTDIVYAVPKSQLRCIVFGDSWTEPTVQDNRADTIARGWPQWMQYLFGMDVWSAGSGGTGFLNPGTGGRVTFRNRLADATAYSPDVWIWNGGTNDIGRLATLGYDATAVGAEASACFAAVKAALPNCLQIVLGPTWPRDPKQFTTGADGAVAVRDAIKSAAASAGMLFVDMMEAPASPTAQASGTLAAASAANANTISSTTTYDTNTMLKIGAGGNAEYRRVQSSVGAGPYTINVQDGGTSLLLAHASGDPVVPTGPAVFTGTGSLTAPAGTGTADRYRGVDQAHPTCDGHKAVAVWVYECVANLLAA
jgi:lysophospholipase L1-like esterase